MFAGGFSYVSPDQFAFSDSIVLLTMALLGGVASPVGAVIGTGLLILIPEWLRFLKSVPGLYLAIYGAAVILIVIFMPDGIWGFIGRHSDGAARGAAAPAGPLCSSPRIGRRRWRWRCRGLAKYFGGLKAVDGVDFQVRRGGVHALIGPNGGARPRRSTWLPGSMRDRGRHLLDGVDVTAMPAASAHRCRARAHVPEHPAVPLDDRARECGDRRRARRQHACSPEPRRLRLRRTLRWLSLASARGCNDTFRASPMVISA